MPINSVSLIAGAMSFSAALAWNKAISDTLNRITETNEPLLQAIIITIIIIIIVHIINVSMEAYTKVKGTPLKYHTLKAGGNKDSRVSLWNNNIF